ncbi:MAG: response regulator [Roseburia sp.]|nr:response regulator [Roseburia sp.]
MREVMLILFCCALAAVAVMGRYMVVAGRRERRRRDRVLDDISNNTDMMLLVYVPKKKKVEYVSDSVSWLFGIDKERVCKDAGYLFERLNFSAEDEFVKNFLEGNLKLSAQREYEYYNGSVNETRWIQLKAVPCEEGRGLLLVLDTTMEHELSDTLLVAVGAVDDAKKANSKLLSAMQQNEEKKQNEKSVFEQPEIGLKDTFRTGGETLSGKEYADKHILLVEDNTINMELACELLRQTGACIDTAANGEEAFEMFRKSEEGYYDLVFMDIQMPVMDGNEATRKIRALERRDAKVVPIVAMTAYIFAEDIRLSFKAGMDMHIAKPLNLEKLSDVMQKYLVR